MLTSCFDSVALIRFAASCKPGTARALAEQGSWGTSRAGHSGARQGSSVRHALLRPPSSLSPRLGSSSQRGMGNSQGRGAGELAGEVISAQGGRRRRGAEGRASGDLRKSWGRGSQDWVRGSQRIWGRMTARRSCEPGAEMGEMGEGRGSSRREGGCGGAGAPSGGLLGEGVKGVVRTNPVIGQVSQAGEGGRCRLGGRGCARAGLRTTPGLLSLEGSAGGGDAHRRPGLPAGAGSRAFCSRRRVPVSRGSLVVLPAAVLDAALLALIEVVAAAALKHREEGQTGRSA